MARRITSKEISKKKNIKDRRAKIAIVQKAVLFSLAAGGGLALALLAPNAMRVLEQFGWVKTKRNPQHTINRSVERLERSGLVIKDSNGFVMLTPKGQKRFSEFERAQYLLSKPEKWDKKWRLVSFDIKEKRKAAREQLRLTLKTAGFILLHHSTWVYPYDCEEFLSLLKADYRIQDEVLYIVAEYVENDDWLRKYFCLS